MKQLNESDIIAIMREEWAKKIQALAESVELVYSKKISGDTINPLSNDLYVKHAKKDISYKIDSISPQDATLQTPEGELFTISMEELENSYVLDNGDRGNKNDKKKETQNNFAEEET